MTVDLLAETAEFRLEQVPQAAQPQSRAPSGTPDSFAPMAGIPPFMGTVA